MGKAYPTSMMPNMKKREAAINGAIEDFRSEAVVNLAYKLMEKNRKMTLTRAVEIVDSEEYRETVMEEMVRIKKNKGE